MKKNMLAFGAAALSLVFVIVPSVRSQNIGHNEEGQRTINTDPISQIRIGNFGKMDDHLFRGAQPLEKDYASLAALGVKTVVDLRNDPTDYEKPAVEALGMRYVNIPMSGWKYANDADVEKFMSVMNDPESGVVYVHCKAGRHRTGLVGAVYRFNKYGWDYDQAYKEMKKYNYSSWPVHFNIKAYVRDYYEKLEKTKPSVTKAAGPAVASATSH